MKKRLLIIILVMTTLGILGFWILSTPVYYDALVKDSLEELQIYMNLAEENTNLTQEGAKETSEKIGGARVTYMTLDGIVIADSSTDTIVGTSHADRDEVIKAIQTGEGSTTRSSETMGKDMVYFCKKVDDHLVRIAVSTASQVKLLWSTSGIIVWFLLVDVVVCAIVAVFFVKSMLDPVEKVARNTKERELLKKKYPELEPIIKTLETNEKTIKKYIAEIEEEKKQVVEAEATKNEFIANITHEMNTPLTSILGFSNLLDDKETDEETKNKAVKNIKKQSERLGNLIACIINFNELDNDELIPYEVDLSQSVKDVVESLEQSAKENGISIEKEIEENITIVSRQERVNEVIGNIVRNAIKYNKENGMIRVSLRREERPVLEIEDTGIGISQENLPRIFDRFYTVDKSHNGKHGGFGLGLAVVKKICKNSGWKIDCKSKLGEGTKFTISFK